MAFERRGDPLASRALFALRFLRCIAGATLVILFSLVLGVVGYHRFAGLGWTDSLYNASMILAGMGPVDPLPDDAAKLFASFYALFAGIAFLTSVGLLIAPVAHRVFHRFHIDMEDDA